MHKIRLFSSDYLFPVMNFAASQRSLNTKSGLYFQFLRFDGFSLPEKISIDLQPAALAVITSRIVSPIKKEFLISKRCFFNANFINPALGLLQGQCSSLRCVQ